MPRNKDKRRCGYPGCGAWSLRAGEYCVAHARQFDGLRLAVTTARMLAATGGEAELPSLADQVRDLLRRRDEADEWLRAMLDDEDGDGVNAGALLAYLRLTSDITQRVFKMLQRIAESESETQDDWISEAYEAVTG